MTSSRAVTEPTAGFDHAWRWFELHATQRLQFVNFWLVAVAFLTAAMATAFSSNLPELAICLALVGALATLGFQGLEKRTKQLVKISESAMARYEKRIAVEDGFEEVRLTDAAERKSPAFLSHSFVIDAMHLTAFVAFCGAAFVGIIEWVA